MRRIGRVGFALALVLASAAPAVAATTSFRIEARVPVSCIVRAETPLEVSDGGQVTGQAFEACNSGGYQVIAQYRPLASDEAAVLQYAGQTIQLPASGQAVVHVSSMATIQQVAYQLQSTHLDSPLAISLSVEPT
jgi:hypothetical protein